MHKSMGIQLGLTDSPYVANFQK
ncbi:MAG: hypothetical protein ACLTS6_13580 [Anaerobutyricum sp.]